MHKADHVISSEAAIEDWTIPGNALCVKVYLAHVSRDHCVAGDVERLRRRNAILIRHAHEFLSDCFAIVADQEHLDDPILDLVCPRASPL